MLLIHMNNGISHMPITELENNSESVRVKVFANKTSHFVASWYRPPGGDLTELESHLVSFKSQLKKIKDLHKGIKHPQSIFCGTSTSVILFGRQTQQIRFTVESISLSEGKMFIDILNDHHLEQLVHYRTKERKALDLITSLPGQFLDIQSPDKLSDHDIVSGFLKVVIPPIKKPRRKVYELRHEKTIVLHMRKQRRRSVSR